MIRLFRLGLGNLKPIKRDMVAIAAFQIEINMEKLRL